MTAARWAVLVAALLAVALSVWQLEGFRRGVEITPLSVGTTPATVWRMPGGADAPVVVIAHGFAGSRQLMEGFALTAARAGFIAVSYDLAGHGRNPVPMSGDVTRTSGTTQVLMDELGRVSDAALALPGADGRLALVGHSMASDIVVRQAARDPRVKAVVAVSMFSKGVTADAPRNLLVVAGAWEGMLAAEALRAVRLSDPGAEFGETVGTFADDTARRAILAPSVEHVGVLYAPTTLREMRDWLGATFGAPADTAVPARGGWVVALMASVVALGWPLAGAMRRARAHRPPPRLAPRAFWTALLLPAVAVPLALWPFELRFLPVLVADYLAVHLGVFGLGALALAGVFGGLRRSGAGTALLLAVPVAVFGIAVFGGALDRHVAAFLPVGARWSVLAAMVAGAVPFLLADAVLTEGGRAGLFRTLAVRGGALASLALAVALDLERLFFLVIILPVILVFFLLFGTVGGWIGRATWRPAAAGAGLGVFLGWALAVTFPVFAA